MNRIEREAVEARVAEIQALIDWFLTVGAVIFLVVFALWVVRP